MSTELKYEGEPCRRCKRTTRYKKNRGCVYCVKAQATRWQSKLAPMSPMAASQPEPTKPEDLI